MAYCWAGVCSRKTAVGVDYSLKFRVLTFLDESLFEISEEQRRGRGGSQQMFLILVTSSTLL